MPQRSHSAAQPIEAVIFDRDGVIAFFDQPRAMRVLAPLLPLSLGELASHWDAQGQHIGWPRTLAEEAVFFRMFWEHLGREYQLPDATVQTLIEWDYKEVLQPFPDAQPVMARLKQRGLKIGVLSNFSLASLEPSLEHLGLIGYVDAACAATVIQAAKPHPDAYKTIAASLGVPITACLFIDDEAEHVAGAQAVGMQAYLIERAGATGGTNASLRRISTLFAILEPGVLGR
jgi:putative hydrolase of the HAD superfamily